MAGLIVMTGYEVRESLVQEVSREDSFPEPGAAG